MWFPPPLCLPVRLDPAQVAATTAALLVALVHERRLSPSLTHHRADSSGSGLDDDEDEISHPSYQHLLYPTIQSLEVGDAGLLFVSGLAGSVPGPSHAQQGDGLYRLSDVHENPWILKATTETFTGPGDLINETTRTWVMRLKITTKLVCLSKQQLREHNYEHLFSEVAGQSLEQLMNVACSFCDTRWSDGHISQQLTVFDTLVDVLFNIQDFSFSRSGEVPGLVHKMLNAFKGVIQLTSNDIRDIKEYIIHPTSSCFLEVLEFFRRNRDMLQSILESGDYNTGPCSNMLDCLISKIKVCAETSFQEKGQRYIFVLNNIFYLLQKKCHPGLFPRSVLSNLDSLLDQYIIFYLDEYWIPPLLSYLDGDSLKKPRRSSMDKFITKTFSIYGSQMTWEVHTELKEILIGEIVELIIPKYVKFLKELKVSQSSHCPSVFKGMCQARFEKPVYTAVQLEQVIREFFKPATRDPPATRFIQG